MAKSLLNKVTKNTYVLYHGNCSDGFGAATVAWEVLGKSAEYIPCHYGQPMPDIPDDKRIYMIDFSYPREELVSLHDRSKFVVVLDHHETAQQDLEGLEFAHFDLDRSGARMAWDYFHPDQDPPDLILYIEDRDLWRWELPYSREVSAALSSYYRDLETWSELMWGPIQLLIKEGAPILRYKYQMIDQMAANAREINFDDYRVPVVNATSEWSEVADALIRLYPDAPFAAAYFDTGDGKRKWSLRSRSDFKVNVIAKRHGGGGHPQAAGFVEDVDEIRV